MKNRLTLIKELPRERGKNGRLLGKRGLFKCECGNEKDILLYSVRSNRTKSCGCFGVEKLVKWNKDNNTTHGLSKHSLKRVRDSIKYRCYNPNGINYHRYGGRGITICDEWLNSLEVFATWALNNGWKKGLQIDRIDNDGNYEPNNCRFVTSAVNNQNKSNNVLNLKEARAIYYSEMGNKSLCNIFGITESQVYNIKVGNVWKNAR